MTLQSQRWLRIALAAAAVAVVLLSLTSIISLFSNTAQASPTVVYYVDDDTCPSVGSGSSLDPWCSIQYAVDSVSSGEILIAEGLYTGTQIMTGTNNYTYTQVVFIDKSLVLRGGYAAGDWQSPSDPINHPSIIDAGRSGRGITILGTENDIVTIDSLTIRGGDYSGLGNPEGQSGQKCMGRGLDCGGGIFAFGVELDLLNSKIEDNFASTPDSNRDSYGGGIYLWATQPGTSIESTAVISNTAPGGIGYGGGLGADSASGVTITGSRFVGNSAALEGGGMYVFQPEGVLTINDSYFSSNTSKYGGSAIKANLTYSGEALVIDRVQLSNNKSNQQGTALYIEQQGSSSVTAALSNLIFNGNSAVNPSSNPNSNVLKITHTTQFEVNIDHITAADNPSGTFIHARTDDDEGDELLIVINNSLLESFYNALVGQQEGSGALQFDYNRMLFDNVTNVEVTANGTVTFNGSGSLTGTADLDNSCHLLPGSDAIDTAWLSQITHDFDNDVRDAEYPDIGADEYRSRIYTPLVFNKPD